MKRANILWLPPDANGNTKSFSVSPGILMIFFLVLFICACSVPFLGNGLFAMAEKVAELEKMETELRSEITALKYVKTTLDNFEERDKILKTYFGMEAYESLVRVMGGGGDSNIMLTKGDDYTQAVQGEKFSIDPRGLHLDNLSARLENFSRNQETIDHLIEKQGEVWENTPSIMPVKLNHPKISSVFGWRKNPFTGKDEFHAGVDVLGPKGSKIIAPSYGKILTVGYDRWLGNYLVIKHTRKLKTIYGHLEKVLVKEGASVDRGAVVGIMGNTGLSTARHLHYGIISGGRAVDPMSYILDWEAQG